MGLLHYNLKNLVWFIIQILIFKPKAWSFVGLQFLAGPNLLNIHPRAMFYRLMTSYNVIPQAQIVHKLRLVILVLACFFNKLCISAGQSVALPERQIQHQPWNSPGWRQQADDLRLRQPRHMWQPSSHGRHAHILSQPSSGVYGPRAQERTHAQLKSDEDYPAQPGGCGAMCWR